MNKCILVTIHCMFLTSVTFSQSSVYQHFSTQNGLPSSEVYDVIEDNWGYLWFSSDHGLSRYDGHSFVNYSTNEGLINNVVFNFFKDEKGVIWCTSLGNEVLLIKGESPEFIPYKWNAVLKKLPHNFIAKRITFDQDGAFFSFIDKRGYLKIDGSGQITDCLERSNPANSAARYHLTTLSSGSDCVMSYNDTKQSILPTKTRSIEITKHIDQKCNLTRLDAISFDNDSSIFIIEGTHLKKVMGSEVDIIDLKSEVLFIKKVDTSQFWVSTRSSGIFFFSKDGRKTESLLPGKSVSSAIIDKEGNLWCTTLNSGVFQFRNRAVKVLESPSACNKVVDLLIHKNTLWASYQNGDVAVWNGSEKKLVNAAKKNRPAHLVQSQDKERLYYISDKVIVSADGKYQTLASDMMGGVEINKYELLIFDFSQVTYLNLKTGKVEPFPNVINRNKAAIEYKGDMYFAGQSGVHILRDNRPCPLSSTSRELNSRIEDALVFRDEIILASSGMGLQFFDGNQITQTITSADGLTSNFISKIYAQDENTLWVCTKTGLNRITFKSKEVYKIQQVTYANGLTNNEVNAVAVHNDTVWVGSNQGINFFPIDHLNKPKGRIPYYLSIKKLLVNDKAMTSKSILELPYDQNRLEFEFTAITFSNKDECLYRYKLEGLESDWKYTKSRRAIYSALPPGTYTFVVQMKGKNDAWSYESDALTILISPPFWKTWWFIISVLAFVIVLGYLFFRFRVLIYNKHLVREILRQILKRLSKKNSHIIVKDGSCQLKIDTQSILYVKSDKNYLEIHTDKEKHVIREKIGNFLNIVPDPIEFLRIRRSYIVRIDKVTQKGKNYVCIHDQKIKVGETYLDELKKIQM